MSIESVMSSNHLILCRSLLLPHLVSPSIRVFSNESVFASGGQSTGVLASASVLPMNIQDWCPLGLWLIGSSCSLRDSQESSPTLQFKSIDSSDSSALSFLYHPTLTSIHDYWKNHRFGKTDFVGKVVSLLFNMLCRLVIAYLPRSKYLWISWLSHHLQWV